MEQETRKLSINEKIVNVDRMLRRLEVKTGDIVQQGEENKSGQVDKSSNFNSRGDLMLAPKEIR